MNDFPIPVRTVGPGSQPEDDAELQYLAMPREMHTFRMPIVPDGAEAGALATARDLLAAFLGAMERWDPAARAFGPRLALDELPAAALEVANQVLGEGEVSIQVAGTRPRTGSRRACSPVSGASARSTATAANPATGSKPACCRR